MKNLIIGIIIGVVLILTVKTVEASGQEWNINFFNEQTKVIKFTDGPHINCYVAEINSTTWTSPAISCINTK